MGNIINVLDIEKYQFNFMITYSFLNDKEMLLGSIHNRMIA